MVHLFYQLIVITTKNLLLFFFIFEELKGFLLFSSYWYMNDLRYNNLSVHFKNIWVGKRLFWIYIVFCIHITKSHRFPNNTRDKHPYRSWYYSVCAVDKNSWDLLQSGPRLLVLLLPPIRLPLLPRRKLHRAESDVKDWSNLR